MSICIILEPSQNLLSRKWGKIKPTKRCKDLGLARAPPRRMRSKIAWFLCRDLLIQTSCSRHFAELWSYGIRCRRVTKEHVWCGIMLGCKSCADPQGFRYVKISVRSSSTNSFTWEEMK
ncbi:uncharacterized protein LOC125206179 [Salvia hispanica]|uniref:uncharacterized protein LOC125206179 n=1 Tax=Salvia hispanica TaxID=49212 RepID=UPI002009CB16|nr:uncharacterized protein LOC125206179 [Salvia hispanica]